MDIADYREAELAKIAESADSVIALQKHMNEIIKGKSFKGRHRSGQFLKFIVDQAIAGHFDSLKERHMGIELFGRSPSYDTGEDAIVRVTASDVRKRLLQHYDRGESISEFRITLPLGSYITQILSEDPDRAEALGAAKTLQDPATITPDSGVTVQNSTLQSAASEKSVAASASTPACAHQPPLPSEPSCERRFPLSCQPLHPPGGEASGSMHKDIRHRHVLPTVPAGWMARHRLVQTCIPDQTPRRPRLIQSLSGFRRSTPIRS